MTRLADLVTEADGRLSGRKLWFHVANTIGSAAFAIDAYHGGLTEWKLLVYLIGVGGNTALYKLSEIRYGRPSQPDND